MRIWLEQTGWRALGVGLLLAASGSAISASAFDAARAQAGPPPLVISDIRPFSFSVSWNSTQPSSGKVEVRLGGKWIRVTEVGPAKATAHLFPVPCNLQSPTCKPLAKAGGIYSVRVTRGSSVVTRKVKTTPILSPTGPLAAIGGQINGGNNKPIKDALVYVTVKHGSTTSVSLATLTLSTGRWLVALANAVTSKGGAFPLSKGDAVTIRALTGRFHATQTVKLSSVEQPLLLKQPLVVR